MLRVVRDVTGITRSQLDTSTGTLTLRASPSVLAVATDLLDDLEQPTGEMILEIEVLEVDRTSALNMGITPPETSTIVSLNSQQIQEAQQSLQGLISVITQLFGQPSALSGLSATQISTLLSAGQIGAGSVLPPVGLFGGGSTTFAATMPGAAAEFFANAVEGPSGPAHSAPCQGRTAGHLLRRRPHPRLSGHFLEQLCRNGRQYSGCKLFEFSEHEFRRG